MTTVLLGMSPPHISMEEVPFGGQGFVLSPGVVCVSQ